MTTPAASPAEIALEEFVEGRLATLRESVANRAQDELDLTWCLHDSPVGTLLLASRRGHLVRVAFDHEGLDGVQDDLTHRFGVRSLRSADALGDVRRQLDDYFDGRRRTFDIPVDLTLSSGEFRREVQRVLPRIEFGRTVSYAELAALAGRPRAVRAAATACATNPVPIVVPCHRIVRTDGSIGAYLGGTQAKTWLLQHEHALPA